MRAGERGFTLIWCMAMVLALGLGLAAVGPMWQADSQRERERELLRVGRLYAQAIASYKKASPGTRKEYPAALQDLIRDPRHVGTLRHLRTAYTDPMVPGKAFVLVLDAQGRILGVRSTSRERPFLRLAPFDELDMPGNAEHYSDWTFTAKDSS